MAAYCQVYDVTCWLTAKNRDQLRNPTLGNQVWATFTIFVGSVKNVGQTDGQTDSRTMQYAQSTI